MTDPNTFYLPVHVYRSTESDDLVEVGYEDSMAPRIQEVVDPISDLDLNILPEEVNTGVKSISYTDEGMYKITMNDPITAEMEELITGIIDEQEYVRTERDVGKVSDYEPLWSRITGRDNTLRARYDSSSIQWPDEPV
jgi:hypothetical protein